MSSALMATASLGCILMASLVLADLGRDYPKFSSNKGTRPSHRRVVYGNQVNRGGNFGANRRNHPFSGKQGGLKEVGLYPNQPGYVDSKKGNDAYVDNRQGNDPYRVQGNMGGHSGEPKEVYNGNQGSLKVADPYNDQLGSVSSKVGDYKDDRQGTVQYPVQSNKGIADANKVSDPYPGNKQSFTASSPSKVQPSYNGNDLNGKELGPYGSQDKEGGKVSASKVYDGNQSGSQAADPYNNQPSYAGGIVDKDQYNKNSNPFGARTVYNGAA